ncbi:hypothetical protein IW140_004117 [Coemansia sp. RSA 1813]|nr:hypothetical protein EV178_004184 [Coemansia sp. RSA 1646]KAJ1770970.1 hypothetical protein LPJ74_002770 [Coemansia sp. RSA 1843]KAJ2088290.1 hypothetical protein IW138_004367 [Coemansia sp. RSA 986]KAJ2213299.1 hypothetical protein EV179_003991 [Coemansia sp. RSA 487]KAJ2568120.1 hypothetical protein IW140_004117 [Coemansia sp. RSA 1813]
MEFSQRPAHPAIPGTHRMMAAAPTPPAPTHYQYVPDTQQPPYASPQYAHPPTDVYSVAPRLLPSVSELLVSQQTVATSPVRCAVPYAYSDHQAQIHPHHSVYTAPPSYATEPQKPLGIDVPKPATSSHHRDSESASSVSSQITLIDNFSPQQQAYQMSDFKQQQISSSTRAVYEDDVFTAASILMSLRACKIPC